MQDELRRDRALLMARSWIAHSENCACRSTVATGDGFAVQPCTCDYTGKLAVIDAALTRPTAPMQEEVPYISMPSIYEGLHEMPARCAEAANRVQEDAVERDEYDRNRNPYRSKSTMDLQPAAASDMVLVPREPTEAMRQAAIRELSGPTDADPKVAAWDAVRAYRAMLSASPSEISHEG